jgi:hypothetical protein
MTHRFFLLLAMALIGSPSVLQAATLCVNPGGTGGCFASLQAAVDAAARNDLIQVAAGTYNENVSLLDKDLTIGGAGAATTIIDGGGTDRVLDSVRSTFTLSGVTLRNGSTLSLAPDEHGGCARINVPRTDRVILSEVVIEDCTAIEGGGLVLRGRVRIERATIRNNTASYGGGIWTGAGPTNVEIVDSTISGNGAIQGGGVASFGAQLRLANSTVSGNTASDLGGGVFINYPKYGRTKIVSSTIAANDATNGGGGIYTDRGKTQATGSILAGNTTSGVGPDCGVALDSSVKSRGYNLFEDSSGCEIRGRVSLDIVGSDPLLGPLANNGGPTATHALLAGSPAIDAGNPRVGSGALLCPPLDQRGSSRNGRCDIGAYEF